MTWFIKQWRQGSDTCESLVKLFLKMLGKKSSLAKAKKVFTGDSLSAAIIPASQLLHHLTQNRRTDCSLNYELSTRKLQVQYMFQATTYFSKADST